MIAIYACKAIDITIVYLAVKMTFCNMNLPVAFAHAATFWTSEFWLMDGLLIFLASNSHGIATIRRAFFFSTVLWVINSVCVTFGWFFIFYIFVYFLFICFFFVVYRFIVYVFLFLCFFVFLSQQ